VAIVAEDAGRLLLLRGPLLRALTAAGHKATCLVSSTDIAATSGLEQLGAEVCVCPLAEASGGFLAGRRTTAELAGLLRDLTPAAVIGIGFAAMLPAAAAARHARVPRLVLVATSLVGLEPASRRVGLAVRWRTRRALHAAQAIVVHNAEHARRLRELDLVPKGAIIEVLPGAGVDLVRFAPVPLPPLRPGLVFTMIARRERSRGVLEFCEAARRVRAKAPAARFVLATASSARPDALDLAQLERFADSVELVPAPADPRALIGECHVLVHPSHGEGIAHEVLQGLACGRSVITTTAPGCREAVDERVSGILVPPADASALVAAIESHLRHPDLIAWMSRAARTKAERNFDAHAAAAGLIGLLGLEA
jgi:glycosyltransferase involved in cell wall biosynthesis